MQNMPIHRLMYILHIVCIFFCNIFGIFVHIFLHIFCIFDIIKYM